MHWIWVGFCIAMGFALFGMFIRVLPYLIMLIIPLGLIGLAMAIYAWFSDIEWHPPDQHAKSIIWALTIAGMLFIGWAWQQAKELGWSQSAPEPDEPEPDEPEPDEPPPSPVLESPDVIRRRDLQRRYDEAMKWERGERL